MGRLRECREKANLSQKYVAISLGVASPSVANWEREKTNPTLDNAIQLADLYGVSLDYLLGRSNDSGSSLTEDELLLLRRYRALGDEDKELLFHPWHLHHDIHGYSWLFQSALLLL